MAEQWLYQQYDALERSPLYQNSITIPSDIVSSLKYPLRHYQERGVKRFIYFWEQEQNKDSNHILFEMATGSGKTLMMASLILYLYKKGYRNFIFFVNSTTIVKKTEANFSDSTSSKYLFKDSIELGSERVNVRAIENLDEASENDINILFTTIQGLHTTLNNEKENSVTFDDLTNHKIVLLADEAHHLNKATKQLEIELEASWENTVQRIFSSHKDNLLLELTATAEIENKEVEKKYLNKLIYKYSLKEFCEDKYAKTIGMIVNRSENKQRILLSLLISQFRQEIASFHGLSIKPVILFKSEKIATSKENEALFKNILENLTTEEIDETLEWVEGNQKTSPLLETMLSFFKEQGVSSNALLSKLQKNFEEEEKIINVNNDAEAERQQISLNSLEDSSNKVRVIFAVNKLNEGWDVLNLFDIVKLYKTKNKKQTTQEVQLIGRGARYCPFYIKDEDSCFQRKYDKERDNILRFLEELHYHTMDETAFIRELNKDMEAQGLITEILVKEVSFHLKESFKLSETYKKGYILKNERLTRLNRKKVLIEKMQDIWGYDNFKIILPDSKDLNVSRPINKKIEEKEFNDKDVNLTETFYSHKTVLIKNIPFSIFYKAISKNNFFRFDKLIDILDLVSSKDLYKYLEKSSITFSSDTKEIEVSQKDLLLGVCDVLEKLEKAIYVNEYEGGEFKPYPIKEVFNKTAKVLVSKNKEVKNTFSLDYFGQEQFAGTREEEALLENVQTFFNDNKENYKEAWLLRNEKHYKIYNFKDGKGFEPDFILFLEDSKDNILTYQL